MQSEDRDAAFFDYESLDPWSAAEDEVLRSLCAGRGAGISWSETAEALPGRSAEQCNLRWYELCAGSIDAVQQETIMSMIATNSAQNDARSDNRLSTSRSASSANPETTSDDARLRESRLRQRSPSRGWVGGTNLESAENHIEPEETSNEPPKSEPLSEPRRTIDSCIKELVAGKMPTVHAFIRPHVPDGDTWAFIKPPAREPGQSLEDYQKIVDRFQSPLRISSQVMKASESGLALKQLSSPTEQFKLIRRCKTTKEKMLAQGIKYVMSLTPPDEGEEAVELIGELSCPKGIVEWVRTSQQWRVGATLVGGHDELTRPGSTELNERVNVPDYTPLRHCFAIERVLAVLHGQSPLLDSAVKLYTAVMTATKHLQIPAYALTDLKAYVSAWVMAPPNCFIVELHPEAVLKIADELQIESLCQNTFAILVGEAALAQSVKNNSSEQPLSHSHNETIHYRQHSPLHEIWESRVQYARDGLVERLSGQFFNTIAHKDMKWVEELPVVKSVIDQPLERDMPEVRKIWIRTLKKFIRGAIYHLLLVDYQEVETPHQGLREGSSYERNMFRDVFNSLDYKDRIFTRTFWKIMRSIDFNNIRFINSNIKVHPDKLFFTITNAKSARKKESQLLSCGIFERVLTHDLQKWTTEVEKLMRASTASLSKQKGPERSYWSGDFSTVPITISNNKFESPQKKARFSQSDDIPANNSLNVPASQGSVRAQLAQRRRFSFDNDQEDQDFVSDIGAPRESRKRSRDELETGISDQGRAGQDAALGQTTQSTDEEAMSDYLNEATQVSETQQPEGNKPAPLAVRSREVPSAHNAPAFAPAFPKTPKASWQTSVERVEAHRKSYPGAVQQKDNFGRQISTMSSASSQASSSSLDKAVKTMSERYERDIPPEGPTSTPTSVPPGRKVLQEVYQDPSDTGERPLGAWVHRKISETHDSYTNALLEEAQSTPGYSPQFNSKNWPSESDWHTKRSLLPLLDQCLKEAKEYLQAIANSNLRRSPELDLDTIDTVASLAETETKVLPLWAGGLDDGSGGVFDDEVPILSSEEDGFRPGHAGMHSADSEMSYDGMSSISDSTANTSKLVNDGISVIADRRQVYAASEIESVVHAPQSVASSSTWEAVDTPAASVQGDLPPEVEEAPDVSDSGSVRMVMEEDDDDRTDAPNDFDLEMYGSDDEFDEDDFNNDESVENSIDENDDEDEKMENEYDFVEREDQRPGTASSEAPAADFAARSGK